MSTSTHTNKKQAGLWNRICSGLPWQSSRSQGNQYRSRAKSGVVDADRAQGLFGLSHLRDQTTKRLPSEANGNLRQRAHSLPANLGSLDAAMAIKNGKMAAIGFRDRFDPNETPRVSKIEGDIGAIIRASHSASSSSADKENRKGGGATLSSGIVDPFITPSRPAPAARANFFSQPLGAVTSFFAGRLSSKTSSQKGSPRPHNGSRSRRASEGETPKDSLQSSPFNSTEDSERAQERIEARLVETLKQLVLSYVCPLEAKIIQLEEQLESRTCPTARVSSLDGGDNSSNVAFPYTDILEDARNSLFNDRQTPPSFPMHRGFRIPSDKIAKDQAKFELRLEKRERRLSAREAELRIRIGRFTAERDRWERRKAAQEAEHLVRRSALETELAQLDTARQKEVSACLTSRSELKASGSTGAPSSPKDAKERGGRRHKLSDAFVGPWKGKATDQPPYQSQPSHSERVDKPPLQTLYSREDLVTASPSKGKLIDLPLTHYQCFSRGSGQSVAHQFSDTGTPSPLFDMSPPNVPSPPTELAPLVPTVPANTIESQPATRSRHSARLSSDDK